jgi:fructose-bisphosphate aldolase, class II
VSAGPNDFSAHLEQHSFEQPSEFDPRAFFKAATAGARAICKARFEAFGCAGRAAQIRPLPLEKMATRYTRGEMRATVH